MVDFRKYRKIAGAAQVSELVRKRYFYCKSCASRQFRATDGFSLIEILIVIVIIGIAAALTVPMFSSAGSIQLSSAANMVAADLDYAKSMAITRQRNYAVIFDDSTESYQLECDGSVIDHPVKNGSFVVNFSSDSRIERVDIYDVDFNGTSRVEFDYLGSPDNGGSVTLRADGVSVVVNVANVTGFVTISD